VPTAALCRILLDEFYLRPRRESLANVDEEANAIICGTGEVAKKEDEQEPGDAPAPAAA
jgi:hypothetical protein